MSAREFLDMYGNGDYSEYDFEIIRSADYKGLVRASDLTENAASYISQSPSYICVDTDGNDRLYMNSQLYCSGNIYLKLDSLEEKRGAGAISESDYEKRRSMLEGVLPAQKKVGDISLSPICSFARDFKVQVEICRKNIRQDGSLEIIKDSEEMDLGRAFLYWATGAGSEANAVSEANSIYWISDWQTANVRLHELPSEVKWIDIVNFIEQKPVKADSVSSRYKDARELRAAAQAEKMRKEDCRKETAERLFSKFLKEGLSTFYKDKLERLWNRQFNAYVDPDYSRLPFYVDGMSRTKDGMPFKLYDQQVKGVSMLTHKGNGLLAYEVGVGKTACGIVATASMVTSGRADRPLIIVPKGVYSKWIQDFRQLFPGIKCISLGNLGGSGEDLEEHFNKESHSLDIPYKAVSFCTYEALANFTFEKTSYESRNSPLMEDFKNLLGVDDSVSDASAAKAIEEALGVATSVKHGSYVFFERCGFDLITVDEAHNFKNLFTIPHTRSGQKSNKNKDKDIANEFSGIGTGAPSARAKKLFAITQLVQRKADRNVFLLTATPFVNNPLEIYSMLSYMGRSALRERNVYNLYDFCLQFADCKAEWVVSASGDVRTRRIMKNFRNTDILHSFVESYIDRVSAEEAGVIRPNKTEFPSKRVSQIPDDICFFEMTPLQRAICDVEIERITDSGQPAGALVAMTNMRRALLSPVLLENYYAHGAVSEIFMNFPRADEFVTSSPKLRLICDMAARICRTFPERGQIIYMTQGITYAPMITDYLEKKGIARGTVEIIDGNTKPETRVKIQNKFNDPKSPVKILIGSPAIKEGVDLNGNTLVEYIAMPEWNTTDKTQVVGRLHRQGNLQREIYVVTPAAYDSVDMIFLQKHEEKAARITSLLDYKSGGPEVDVGELSPEEEKIALMTDPQKRADLEISIEVKRLEVDLDNAKKKLDSFESLCVRRLDKIKSIDEYKKMRSEYESMPLTFESRRKTLVAGANYDIKRNELMLDTTRRNFHDIYDIDSSVIPAGQPSPKPLAAGENILMQLEAGQYKDGTKIASWMFGEEAEKKVTSFIVSQLETIAGIREKIHNAENTRDELVVKYKKERENRIVSSMSIDERCDMLCDYIISNARYRDPPTVSLLLEQSLMDRKQLVRMQDGLFEKAKSSALFKMARGSVQRNFF